MGQPWGLSGPEFLGLYAAAFVVSLFLLPGVRRLVSRVPARGPEPELGWYDTAYLVAGPDRLVDTVLGQLILTERVTVARSGELTATAGAMGDELETAVLQYIQQTRGARRTRVAQALRHHPAVTAADRRLTAGGLTLGRGRRTVIRLTALLPVAVWVVGVVRAVNGARLHRPISDLVVMLFFSGVITLGIVLARRVRYAPSARGRALTKRLLRERRSTPAAKTATDTAVDAKTNAGGVPASLQMAGIALVGLAALDDPTIRRALLPTGGGGGTSSSSGSNCGGGGGGCGGGCGGGGCGG